MTALAPVREQSDTAGTAINTQCLALLCDLCGLGKEMGWSPVGDWDRGPKS